MKKIILFLSVFLLVGILPLSAQNCLVLLLRDGSQYSYLLAEKPLVTFADGDVKVHAAILQTSVPLAEVQNFHFADAESGIPALSDNECRIAYTDGVVTVEGCKGNVSLFDLNGRLLQTIQAKEGQPVSFDLTQQSAQVFVLRAGRQSVKLHTEYGEHYYN